MSVMQHSVAEARELLANVSDNLSTVIQDGSVKPEVSLKQLRFLLEITATSVASAEQLLEDVDDTPFEM